jgi:hypothetical protein
MHFGAEKCLCSCVCASVSTLKEMSLYQAVFHVKCDVAMEGCCAGDEVVAGSVEVQDVVPYADLDLSLLPRQFVTGISKKQPDGSLEELIKARTTWV